MGQPGAHFHPHLPAPGRKNVKRKRSRGCPGWEVAHSLDGVLSCNNYLVKFAISSARLSFWEKKNSFCLHGKLNWVENVLFQLCMFSSLLNSITPRGANLTLTDWIGYSRGLLMESNSHVPSDRYIFYHHFISWVVGRWVGVFPFPNSLPLNFFIGLSHCGHCGVHRAPWRCALGSALRRFTHE